MTILGTCSFKFKFACMFLLCACASIAFSQENGAIGHGATLAPDKYNKIWDEAVAKNDWNLGVTNYQKLLDVNSNDVFALEGYASCLAAKGDMNGAIIYYTRAINIDPSYALSYFNRGNVSRGMGDFTNAVTDLNKYLTLAPADDVGGKGMGHKGRAYARLGVGDFEGAIKDFDEGLKLDSKDVVAFIGRAGAFKKLRNYDQALADYKQAMAMFPDSAEAFNAYAWFRATCADPGMRNAVEAIDVATKVCDLSGWKNWRYIDTLAAAYAENGDFQKAISFENQAMAGQGISDIDLAGIKNRIVLFQKSQPYRE